MFGDVLQCYSYELVMTPVFIWFNYTENMSYISSFLCNLIGLKHTNMEAGEGGRGRYPDGVGGRGVKLYVTRQSSVIMWH